MFKLATVLSVLLLLTACGGSDEFTASEGDVGDGDAGASVGKESGGSNSGGSGSGSDTNSGGSEAGGSGGFETGVGGSETGGTAPLGGTGGDMGPPPICTPGDSNCQGDILSTCANDGLSFEETECDFVCEAGACSGGCTPGDTQCNGDVVAACSASGTWVDTQTCTFVCDSDSGSCGGACTPGAKKCDGDTPQVCDDQGQWVDDGEACEFLCSAGSCTGACTPGDTQCNDQVSQTCNTGGSWDDTQTCGFVCSGAGSCTGVCTPGAVDCLGDTPRSCNAQGQWVSGSECPFLCSAGSCTGSCEPGEAECNGKAPRSCNGSGAWVQASNCTYVCSGAGNCTGVCTPGATRCGASGDAEICDGMGQWQFSEACDFTCSAGSCGGVCTPGAQRCSMNSAQTCSASGQWQTDEACPYACSAGSCVGVCVPGTVECSGTGTKTCGSNGSWQNVVACPDTAAGNHESPTCSAATCGLACDAGWGDVNGNPNDGCEHDVFTDPDNCGAPGNSCFGGTCSAGVCEFEDIEEIASLDNNSAFALVHNGGYLYMATSTNDIVKIKADGTADPVILASGYYLTYREALVVENGEVFWSADCTNVPSCSAKGIYKVSTSGGAVTQISTRAPSALDVENGKVYWNEGAVDKNDICPSSSLCQIDFWSTPTTGGADTKNFTFTKGTYARIRVIGSSLYTVYASSVSNGDNLLTMVELNVTTGAFVRILASNLNNVRLKGQFVQWAFNDTHVFFYSDTTGSYQTRKAALDGSGEVLLSGILPSGSNVAMVVDDSYLYFSKSNLQRVGVNGGSPVALAPYHTPNYVTQDANYIYWVSWFLGDGAAHIFRLAK